jgi:cytochrome bd-type quinol oxidase subunit 1
VSVLAAATEVDLARIQFALTSLYHFLFVPLTLGLAPLVAVMQTLWHRKRDEAWLRLTRFFGTLLLINFAIGVATGLVQEFQFGMNWSVYSEFVGNVFGAPLAIEGLAAFSLEAVFLGLWVFGSDRLPPRLHLATGSFSAKVEGLNQIQAQYEQRYGPGDYVPPVRSAYWAMRVMAYLGTLVVLLALVGAVLYRRGRLETTRWFLWPAVAAIALPYVAALSGWVLTEVGRQPWIVQGLLRTADANSPSVSSATIAVSLGVFGALYVALAVVDFVLMRRFATADPPEVAA